MLLLSDSQRRCVKCGSIYEWRRSSSRSLKLQYCTFSCERMDLGTLIEDILVTFQRPVVDLSSLLPTLEEV